jgi:putative heme-binding domain-containing protein
MRLAFPCLAGLACLLVAGLNPGQSEVPQPPPPPDIAPTGPKTPEEERKCFKLPPGFEAQLVAAEPYVRKPININFDDRGRLWVTESVEYPFAAAAGAPHRDTIRILEDTNGDGLADEVTTFTSGLNIPIGVLPVTGGAIAYSIPNIYRLRDLDGDDRADRREVLLGSFGHRDTHGMTGEFTWGFDGWVYACHGYANTSVVKAADGSRIEMNSGNTYRFKPDGSRVEQFTHGQVNPFGLAFDPLGNLYSCDCHSRPVYLLLRGAYYPSFGKPDDGLGFGPEMMTHDHGSTAIAGITYYAADHFPPEYRDTVFVGNVVTNRINHDRLEQHGSTYRAIQQPDFLESTDQWFRPVDIKLGPDGALYVADFYNRIIGHYEVPLKHPGRDRVRGRIWRIVYRGPNGKGNPRPPRRDYNKATVAELVGDLASPNLTVRMKATNQLVERGGKPAAAAVGKLLHGPSSPFQRMHGLWVLERLGALDDATLRPAVGDPASGVRVHAQRVLSERRELSPKQRAWVIAGLHDPDAFVQRAAADALGTHPAFENLRPLLDLRHVVPSDDNLLLHVVRMALRNQLQAPGTWARVPDPSWSERDRRAIADVAPGVPSVEAAAFLLEHLQRWPEPYEKQLQFVHHVARHGVRELDALLFEYVRGDRAASLHHRADLFRAIQKGVQERGVPLTAARGWGEGLTRELLASSEDGDIVAGIELGGSLKTQALRGVLAAMARDRGAPENRRIAAVNALVAIDPAAQVPLLGQLLEDAGEAIPFREKAAYALAAINQPAAQAELLKALAAAPERLAVAIAAALAGSRPGAEGLLGAVAAGKASAKLLQEPAVVPRLQAADVKGLTERLAQLTRDLPPADKRVQELLDRRRAGFARAKADPGVGARVFEKNCANCHQLANKGAKIGPQLDGVGIRGLDRLLEDILDPNRNVDQAFRLTTLVLAKGQLVSGLLLREEGQVLVLADNQGKEVRVPKDAVDERTVSQLSPMPADLAAQIPEADFYHLVAFLLTQQPPREAKANGSTLKGTPGGR